MLCANAAAEKANKTENSSEQNRIFTTNQRFANTFVYRRYLDYVNRPPKEQSEVMHYNYHAQESE